MVRGTRGFCLLHVGRECEAEDRMAAGQQPRHALPGAQARVVRVGPCCSGGSKRAAPVSGTKGGWQQACADGNARHGISEALPSSDAPTRTIAR